MNAKIHVLLAEDEPFLGAIVKESLETRGFEVTLCENGADAQRACQHRRPDIAVLDVMMPQKDGFTLAREIRRADAMMPIIFLTARSRTEDVVEGFGYGANDYVKKPFSMEELIVRIQAQVQRLHTRTNGSEWIQIGQYNFHMTRQLLRHASGEELLTHREAQLLHQLILHKNNLLERRWILRELWGNDDFFNARSMDVFISKLRKRLSGDPSLSIVNIRGYGYKLTEVR